MYDSDKVIRQLTEHSAEDIVKTGINVFTQYLIISKLPNCLDGLKQVHRRLLWVMRNSNDKIKVTKPVAEAMAIHPHGDSSILNVAARLTQEFSIGQPLIKSHSSEGNYASPKAAQARYFDVSISEFSKDLFFNGVSPKIFHMIPNYDFSCFEPEYFIPKLPTALLFPNLTLGMGFYSSTNPLNLDNLCELIQRFVEHKQKNAFSLFNFGNYPHLFIPDYPIPNEIRNYDELIFNYKMKNYNCKVATDGILEIKKNIVQINTIPYGNSFEKNVKDIIHKAKHQKNFWLNKYISLNGLNNYDDASNKGMTGCFNIDFKSNVDIFSILETIKKTVNFSVYKAPIPKFVNDFKIREYTPPQLIELWYNARCNSIVTGLREKLISLAKERQELEIKLLARPKIDKIIELIMQHKGATINVIANALLTLFDNKEISLSQAYTLARMRLYSISQGSEELFRTRLEEVENAVIIKKSEFNKLNETIYDDAEYFRKKYKRKRRTVYNKYIGYIKINKNGIIQYLNENELFELLERFSGDEIKIYPYKDIASKKSLVLNNKIIESNLDIPKQTQGDAIVRQSRREKYSVSINTEHNTIFYSDKTFYDVSDNIENIPVSKNFYAIKLDGSIEQMSINNLSLRKDATARGIKTDIIYVIPERKNNIFLLHMSTEQPNILRIEKILESENNLGKITTPPMGRIHVLGTLSDEIEEYIFNVPQTCIKRMSIEYLKIININEIMLNKTNITIDLNKNTNGIRISKHPHCKKMLVI